MADAEVGVVIYMNLAPVVLFAYRRVRHLADVVEGLQGNPDAVNTTLIVYCDAAASASHLTEVQEVREFTRGITGFAALRIIERERNYGLSRSITEGVAEVCEEFGRAIVLEDDIVPSDYFLSYVNAALEKYADDDRVLCIGCYTFDVGIPLPESFFLRVPDCWGWAVWRRSWKFYDPDGLKLLTELRRRDLHDTFDFDGAYPYCRMLEDQALGYNDSWAVRWYAKALLEGKLVLYPGRSVTANIGFDATGTHAARGAGRPTSMLTDRPIEVADIGVEENVLARAVWETEMRRMRPPLARRVLYDIRSRIARLLRRHHLPNLT